MHKSELSNVSEIPKRNSFRFVEAVEKTADIPFPTTSRRELLERTKLSNSNLSVKPVCAGCDQILSNQRDYLKANVCDKCLRIFAAVDAELNRHSTEKAKANRLKMFARS